MNNIIDLFCGCGGMSLGFQNAGFNINCAVDNWSLALENYKNNLQHEVRLIDISDFHQTQNLINDFQHVDGIIGGPPCQDFSEAGKRNENGKNAQLTVSFAEIITQIRPKYFVMENVARTLKSQQYAKAKQLFKSSEYGLTEIILDASLCGVPQKRKRLFVIGCLNQKDNFLYTSLINNLSLTSLTVRQYMGNEIDFEHYYRHPRTYARRAIYSIDEPSPTIRGVNRPKPSNYKYHVQDSSQDINISHLNSYQRSRLQTFPNDYKLTGSQTNIEQMIGNAVPVNLAFFVADVLNNFLKNQIQIFL